MGARRRDRAKSAGSSAPTLDPTDSARSRARVSCDKRRRSTSKPLDPTMRVRGFEMKRGECAQ
ncbi:hypothetical protein HMPREF0321_0411 [Dermacoccus sp. Ellin185]|nr:hypothetical protein HMPREF0321_0411 [Dermacoccus sp. Ellin185]